MAKKQSKWALPENAFELAKRIRRAEGVSLGVVANEIEEWGRRWEEHLTLKDGYYLLGPDWVAAKLLGYAPKRECCGDEMVEFGMLSTVKPRLYRCQKPKGHTGTHAESPNGMGRKWHTRSTKRKAEERQRYEAKLDELRQREREEKAPAKDKAKRNARLERQARKLVREAYGKGWSVKVQPSGRAVLLAPKAPSGWRGNQPTLGWGLPQIRRALEAQVGR